MSILDKILSHEANMPPLATDFRSTFANQMVLVTGGTGFVGSHLVEKLVELGATVIVVALDTNPLSYFALQGLSQKTTVIEADVIDYERIGQIIKDQKIDYIFHLAAQPLVDVAYANPRLTLKTNIMGTINVLDVARQLPNIKAVVVASSDKSYGSLNKEKYTETDPVNGEFPYDVSKSAVDLITKSYYKTYHTQATITRFGNIYGEGDINFSRIIPKIMQCLVKNEQFPVHGDGSFVRDYLYVGDIINGCLLLAQNIEKTRGEAFNFGSHDTLSILAVIKVVEKALNKKINYTVGFSNANELSYQSLDYTKVGQTVGWQPSESIATKAQAIYDWYAKSYFERE